MPAYIPNSQLQLMLVIKRHHPDLNHSLYGKPLEQQLAEIAHYCNLAIDADLDVGQTEEFMEMLTNKLHSMTAIHLTSH